MTVRELDRLVTKTELSPVSKKALSFVRQAVISGVADGPDIGSASWSVAIDTLNGVPVRMNFSFKRVNDGR
jgi:hypothetical protein